MGRSNGLVLEGPTKNLAKPNLKSGTKIVEIGTEVLPESEWIYDFSFPKDEGKPLQKSSSKDTVPLTPT